ncbi:MAG: hypothetical protein RSF86_04595 [Angelakisella sp.]
MIYLEYEYGNMGENCANYLVTLPTGKTLFYGVDTGPYLEETFDALKKVSLDILISECTFGNGEDSGPPPHGHLAAATCMEMFGRLLEQKTISPNTRIYLTHINHCHTATHAMLCDLFAKTDFPCQMTVAYDGMQITEG